MKLGDTVVQDLLDAYNNDECGTVAARLYLIMHEHSYTAEERIFCVKALLSFVEGVGYSRGYQAATDDENMLDEDGNI